MGYVTNWLHDHNFYHDDQSGSKDTVKTIWEAAFMVVLVVMVVVSVIALVAPNTAAIILSYFL